MSNTDVKKNRAFDPMVFWISAGLTAAFVVWAAVFPDNMNKVICSGQGPKKGIKLTCADGPFYRPGGQR